MAQDNADTYQRTIARMEPDLAGVDHAGAIASIAISLKRIADALERVPAMSNPFRNDGR